ANAGGTYTFQLAITVTDAAGNAIVSPLTDATGSQVTLVTVTVPDEAPVANAGPNQTVVGTSATLDGLQHAERSLERSQGGPPRLHAGRAGELHRHADRDEGLGRDVVGDGADHALRQHAADGERRPRRDGAPQHRRQARRHRQPRPELGRHADLQLVDAHLADAAHAAAPELGDADLHADGRRRLRLPADR